MSHFTETTKLRELQIHMKVVCGGLNYGLQPFFEIFSFLIILDTNTYALKSIQIKAYKGISFIPANYCAKYFVLPLKLDPEPSGFKIYQRKTVLAEAFSYSKSPRLPCLSAEGCTLNVFCS